MTGVTGTPLDTMPPERVARIRAVNDRKYRGWDAKRVIRLHQQTLAATEFPDEYLDGIREHLTSGVYRRIYPPHVVEATRLFLAQLKSAQAKAEADARRG
jgi:hypothetical protein